MQICIVFFFVLKTFIAKGQRIEKNIIQNFYFSKVLLMQVWIQIWTSSLISPLIDRNGLHNNVLSYKEMWKIAPSSPSFEDIHREQQSLPAHDFYLTSHNSILHVFCLCSSSKACPNSLSSAFIFQQCIKHKRGEEETELLLGVLRVHRKKKRSCKC